MERSEARALNLSKYYTGRPCNQGHLGYRYTQSGTCSECINPKSHKEPPKQYDSRYMERPEAVKLGLSKYTTGRPCKNGHLTYRYTVSASCSACVRPKFVKPPKQYDPRYTERAEAIEKGMSQYTTGRPCKRGHLTYRYTVSGSCSDCRIKSEKPPKQYDPRYMERPEAVEKGMSQYTTGRPCKRGHLTYRYTVSGSCSACVRPKFEKPPKQYDPRYMERPEAVEKGMSQYTTGRPCKQGHLTYRYTVSGSCSACVRPKFEKRTDPDLVTMKVRVWDETVAEVDAIVHFMAVIRVPSLTMRYVTFNNRRTSVGAGTSLRHYRVHKDDHDSLKAMLVAKFNERVTSPLAIQDRPKTLFESGLVSAHSPG